MLEIIKLKEEHIDDLAGLVSLRYRRLREHVPHLPSRYEDIGLLSSYLEKIVSKSDYGVTAIRGNKPVGFLTAWQMASFRGKPSVYSPEWANAADPEDSYNIYQEMYGRISADWVSSGYPAHYISLFPHDDNAMRAWFWMGFGMTAVDALRGLDPIPGDNTKVSIRRAAMPDLEAVIRLQDFLRKYSKSAPIYLLTDKKDSRYYAEWFNSHDKSIWLACHNDDPVAFIRMGPADEDVCTIINDEKTTSIYSAFTIEKWRRGGIATALLDCALNSARTSGYERCAVSFEPMNLLGTLFWLRYFQPVCFSIYRLIDERAVRGDWD